MNWSLILWFAGVVATIYGLKFVIVFFRSMFNKDSMNAMVNNLGDSINQANKKLTKKINQKVKERRERKRDENRAIIYPR